jgi:outer membrane protein assembly factor BamD (BamD/ComL family)
LWKEFASTLSHAAPEPLNPLHARRLVIAVTGNRLATKKHRVLSRMAIATICAAVFGLGLWFVSLQLGLPQTTTATRTHTGRSFDNRIVSGQSGVVEIASGARIWPDVETLWRVTRNDSDHVALWLESGSIVVEIEPHREGSRFIVATREGEIEVRGTIFRVSVRPGEGTTVTVASGIVETRTRIAGKLDGFQSQTATAGQTAVLDGNPSRIANPEELQLLETIMAPPYPFDHAEDTFDQEVHSPPRPLPQVLDAPSMLKNKSASRDNEPTQETDDRNEELALLLEKARKLRKSGTSQETAALYGEIISRFPKNGISYILLAQLELVELARPGRALEYFETYLRLEPQGFLAETARLGIVRACDRLGLLDRLLLAADDYAQNHPSGPFGAEVTATQGDALRQQGNCKQAVQSYRRLLDRWPGSAYADIAQKGLTACEKP